MQVQESQLVYVAEVKLWYMHCKPSTDAAEEKVGLAVSRACVKC